MDITKTGRNFNKNSALHVIQYFIIIVISGLVSYLISFAWEKNIVLIHTTLELVCIFIALTSFITVWYTYDGNYLENRIIGFGFLMVAIFDIFHAFYYAPLKFYPDGYTDLAARYWVVGRLTEAAALLVGFTKPVRLGLGKWTRLSIVVSIALGASLLILYYPGLMPKLLNENMGVTTAKILLEYFIIGLQVAVLFFIWKSDCSNNTVSRKYIFLGLLFAIPAEFCFALYSSLNSFYMVLGHVLKIVFYYYLFRSIFLNAITYIYDKSQRAISRSEEKFRSAFDYVHTGVTITSLDGRWLQVNDGFCKMTGYAREELIKMHFRDITHPEDLDKDSKYSKELIEGNSHFFTIEKRYVKKNGEVIWIFLSVTLVRDEENNPLYFITQIQDISERKQAKELQKRMDENLRQLKEAREIDKLKTEFFANLSHEFKTPLNVILGSIQLIDLYAKNGKLIEKDVINKHITSTKQNCRRLLRLVNNLIDATKMDTGHFDFIPQNTDIVSLVEDITLSVADYIKSMGINITFDTDVEEKIIACDPDAIERIVLNLLSNATKFTKQGGNIFVSIKFNNNKIFLSIRDTGIGIAKDKQKMIFERFIQVDKSLTRNHEGSGIGLSLVKDLVEMHEGRIYVESEYRKGSEFTIELPVKVLSEEENEVQKFKMYEKDGHLERMNIEFSDIYMVG